ncbi:MAG: surface protein, partial [Rickettsiales bacterium]
YWFENLDGAFIVQTEGACDTRDYTSRFSAISNSDGSSVIYVAGTSSSNLSSLPCITGYLSEAGDGYYFNDVTGDLTTIGSCISDPSIPSPDCYTTPLGTVADSNLNGCGGQLVVDRHMLKSAGVDGTFDFKPGDIYTTHESGTYDFSQVFTGQIFIMENLLNSITVPSNVDISGWDLTNVHTIKGLFQNGSFVGDISGWNVSNVTRMDGMLSGIHDFVSDITGWDVSSVYNMDYMFAYNDTFNQDISGWDVGSLLTNAQSMFYRASAFNQDISGWDVSNITNMRFMFADAFAFNQDISGWDVSNVTNMSYTFYRASAFDQDISDWSVHVCGKNIASSNFFTSTPVSWTTEERPDFGACN